MASLARRKSVSLPTTQSAVFRALDQRAGVEGRRWREISKEGPEAYGAHRLVQRTWLCSFSHLPTCNLGQRHILLSVS